MVGRVQKAAMYTPFVMLRYIPDWRAARLWWSRLRNDKRPNAVLNAIIDELNLSGIHLIDSTSYCADQLAGEGVMTRRQPGAVISPILTCAMTAMRIRTANPMRHTLRHSWSVELHPAAACPAEPHPER